MLGRNSLTVTQRKVLWHNKLYQTYGVKFTDGLTKEELDILVSTYQKNLMTHDTFIDCIIQKQKRLVLKDLCRPGDGVVAGEVLLRRMKNAGIEVSI